MDPATGGTTLETIITAATDIITAGATAGVSIVTTMAGNDYGAFVLGAGIAGTIMAIGMAIFRKVL